MATEKELLARIVELEQHVTNLLRGNSIALKMGLRNHDDIEMIAKHVVTTSFECSKLIKDVAKNRKDGESGDCILLDKFIKLEERVDDMEN